MENSVEIMREPVFFNQVALTMEVHTELRNYVSNSESKKATRNHTLIHTTLRIIVINITVGNQIRATDVDRSIISSQIVQNRTLQDRNFTGTLKILKLVRTG